MPVIVVANPKGGVGKTTLAANIAGCFAAQRKAVMLGDVDRQQSSRTWLGLRPAAAPGSKPGTSRTAIFFARPKGSVTWCSTRLLACTPSVWTR